jgi:tripeptide aminopeptidase
MPLGRIDNETTANIGRFAGGGPTNVVCERVDIDAEARSLVPEKLDRQVAAMREAFESAAAEFGARAEFTSEIIYTGYKYDESDEVVRVSTEAVRRLGLTPRLFHSGGGSDANIFNGLGFPTVNLAIGYENIHTTKEQMPVASLVQATELAVEIIRTVADKG